MRDDLPRFPTRQWLLTTGILAVLLYLDKSVLPEWSWHTVGYRWGLWSAAVGIFHYFRVGWRWQREVRKLLAPDEDTDEDA